MNSRNKGAGAERELARLIHDELGVQLVRNLEQSRSGGYDLIPHPEESGPVGEILARYAIEAKRYRKSSPALLRSWWRQATTQAEQACLSPLLAYREDRREWRVVLHLSELTPAMFGDWACWEWAVELSLPGFAALVREWAA